MKRGFTLAEVLIALALSAIAIGIISQGVRQSLRFQQSLESRRIEREAEGALLAALRSRLENLVPVVRQDGDREDGDIEDGQLLFVGQADRLSFVSADPGYPSVAGLYEYQIVISSDGSQEDINEAIHLHIYRRQIVDLDSFGRADPSTFQSWSYLLNTRLEFGYATDIDSGLSALWSDQQAYPAVIQIFDSNTDQTRLFVELPRSAPSREDEEEGAD